MISNSRERHLISFLVLALPWSEISPFLIGKQRRHSRLVEMSEKLLLLEKNETQPITDQRWLRPYRHGNPFLIIGWSP